MALWKRTPTDEELQDQADAVARKRELAQLGRQTELYTLQLLTQVRVLRQELDRGTT